MSMSMIVHLRLLLCNGKDRASTYTKNQPQINLKPFEAPSNDSKPI